MDADKEGKWTTSKNSIEEACSGGILSVHNAIRQANAMRDYLEMIRSILILTPSS